MLRVSGAARHFKKKQYQTQVIVFLNALLKLKRQFRNPQIDVFLCCGPP